MKAISGGLAIPQLGAGTKSDRFSILTAVVVAALLVGLTLASHAFLNVPGPNVRAFLPIVATIWSCAEVLTAFLLLSQFYVVGKTSFAVLAAAYGTSGLMTIPYLGWFPNIFVTGHMPIADVQISAWLWIIWHVLFPICIAVAHFIDPTMDTKIVLREAIVRTLAVTVAGSASFASAATALIYFTRASLPQLVTATGHFTELYRVDVIPVVVAVNALALTYLLVRAGKKMSPLQLWIAIALLTMGLDGLVNCWSPARYSVVWYVGKFEAVLTSLTVLFMLLLEVATLYRRLYDVASIDTLTGLPNRRSLNDFLEKALEGRELRMHGLALLVVDIDNFKSYNDRYGHAVGDAALTTVGSALRGSLLRADDFVGRFGGEEFVILLPDIRFEEVARVAERVRNGISKLAIVHEKTIALHLTISIGAVYCAREEEITASTLFDYADRALYAAKAAGRNCVVTRRLEESKSESESEIESEKTSAAPVEARC